MQSQRKELLSIRGHTCAAMPHDAGVILLKKPFVFLHYFLDKVFVEPILIRTTIRAMHTQDS